MRAGQPVDVAKTDMRSDRRRCLNHHARDFAAGEGVVFAPFSVESLVGSARRCGLSTSRASSGLTSTTTSSRATGLPRPSGGNMRFGIVCYMFIGCLSHCCYIVVTFVVHLLYNFRTFVVHFRCIVGSCHWICGRSRCRMHLWDVGLLDRSTESEILKGSVDGLQCSKQSNTL